MSNIDFKVSKKALKQYILLFAFMLIHGNRILTLYNDYILIAVLLLGILTIISKPGDFGKNNILFLGMLTATLLCISVFTSGSLMVTTVFALLSRFVIAFLAYGVDKNRFIERFLKMVLFIACVSLVGFVLTQTIPEFLKRILPCYVYYYTSPWSGKAIARPTYYALIYQFRADADISRNIGMFNESGLYQIVLNTAIYFMVFYKEKCNLTARKYKCYLAIFVITLISAQSATGLIAFAIICCGYILAEKQGKRWKAIFVGIILLVALCIYLSVTGTDSWLYRSVLRKLISEDGSIDLMRSTGKSRIVSMMADMRIFFENPFGNGTKYYESVWKSYLSDAISDSSSPVGMTNSLAVYGIFPVIMIWGYYIWNKWKNKNGLIDWAVCILLIINTTLAQPSIFFPCFIVMVLAKSTLKNNRVDSRSVDNHG